MRRHRHKAMEGTRILEVRLESSVSALLATLNRGVSVRGPTTGISILGDMSKFSV